MHSYRPTALRHSFLQCDVVMRGILSHIHSLILVLGTGSADEKMEDKSDLLFLSLGFFFI